MFSKPLADVERMYRRCLEKKLNYRTMLPMAVAICLRRFNTRVDLAVCVSICCRC